MKFIIYSYYLIYKFTEEFAKAFHEPKTDEAKKAFAGNVTFYAESLFTAIQILYIINIGIFSYLLGFKEIETIIKACNKTTFIIVLGAICFIFDYFVIDSNSKKYFEEFRQFTDNQKLTYSFVAVILILLPIGLLILGCHLL